MKKILLTALLALCMCTTALAAEYSDGPADSWARESVDKAAQYGLMNGVDEGVFGYGDTISREQFVTVLVRMLGWESAGTGGEDAAVDITDSWARESVAFCYASGILDESDMSVEPTRPILRCEIAQMLYNMLERAELL